MGACAYQLRSNCEIFIPWVICRVEHPFRNHVTKLVVDHFSVLRDVPSLGCGRAEMSTSALNVSEFQSMLTSSQLRLSTLLRMQLTKSLLTPCRNGWTIPLKSLTGLSLSNDGTWSDSSEFQSVSLHMSLSVGLNSICLAWVIERVA
jgi:hypothetical protein